MASSLTHDKLDPSVHFGTKSTTHAVGTDNVSMEMEPLPGASFLTRWVPPIGVPEDDDDYPSSALGGDRLS